MSKLIHGINPRVISTIQWRKGGIFKKPKVIIRGADGSVLKTVRCRTAHDAKVLHNIAKVELELSCSTGS